MIQVSKCIDFEAKINYGFGCKNDNKKKEDNPKMLQDTGDRNSITLPQESLTYLPKNKL